MLGKVQKNISQKGSCCDVGIRNSLQSKHFLGFGINRSFSRIISKAKPFEKKTFERSATSKYNEQQLDEEFLKINQEEVSEGTQETDYSANGDFREFFWREVKFLKTTEEIEEFYLKNQQFYTDAIGLDVTLTQQTKLINVESNFINLDNSQSFIIKSDLYKAQKFMKLNILPEIIDYINNKDKKLHITRLSNIGACFYRMGIEHNKFSFYQKMTSFKTLGHNYKELEGAIDNERTDEISLTNSINSLLNQFFLNFFQRWKDMAPEHKELLSIEGFLFLLSNQNLIESDADREDLLTIVMKKKSEESFTLRSSLHLISVIKGFKQTSLYQNSENSEKIQKFILGIEEELAPYCSNQQIQIVIKILNIYSYNDHKGINLNLFDAISQRLSYQVPYQSLKIISQILECMSLIGEERIHFLSIVARNVVQRLDKYEKYQDSLNEHEIKSFMQLENFSGLVTDLPSKNQLMLEGSKEAFVEIEKLEIPEKIRGKKIGNLGYEVFQPEFWDAFKLGDKYLAGTEEFQGFYEMPNTQYQNQQDNQDLEEEKIDDFDFELKDLTGILYHMTRLNFYQDVFYLTMNKFICLRMEESTGDDLYKLSYSHSRFLWEKWSNYQSHKKTYQKRSEKNMRKFNDEFYMALAPSQLDHLEDLDPHQLNEIFIGATRPKVKQMRVKRVMIGQILESMKTVSTKLESPEYSQAQKYLQRNCYYQMVKISSGFCYDDKMKIRINDRIVDDKINFYKLKLEQDLFIIGYDFTKTKFANIQKMNEEFMLESEDKNMGYYRIKSDEKARLLDNVGKKGKLEVMSSTSDSDNDVSSSDSDVEESTEKNIEAVGEENKEVNKFGKNWEDQGFVVQKGGVKFYDLTKDDGEDFDYDENVMNQEIEFDESVNKLINNQK